MLMLSANDKTIKLWKVSNKAVKKSEKFPSRSGMSQVNLKLPKLKTIDQTFCPSLKRVFPNLHSYHVHSVSVCNNNSSFLSSDDLSVLAWDMEELKTTYAMINIKPPSMNELTEVITSAIFSNVHDSMFAVGTSKGILKLFDTRESARFLNNGVVFEDEAAKKNKNLFTDIVSSISDVKFTTDGNLLIARDYLSVKLWDARKTREPIRTIATHFTSGSCRRV
jgi:serine/threonine-protein phosphatase 2A regulatory subunit B